MAEDLHAVSFVSRPLLLILVAAVVLAVACAREQPRSDSVSADTTMQPPNPATAMHLTEQGIGPVRIGMTVAQLRLALPSVRFTDADSLRCAYPQVEGLPDGAWVMVEQGIVGRIDIQKGDVATAEGVRIGDTEGKVRSVYGARVTASPHKYTDGRYLAVRPASGDSSGMIIFETNAQGTVLRFRAGKLPQVRYVEGCS